jgi:hypothetical protein
MAVDFGMLAQVPSIGRSFMAGQEAVRAEQDRNMLRQQQAEQMQFQRENMLAQREDRRLLAQERTAKTAQAAQRQKFLSDFGAKLAEGGYKLDRPTLGQMLQAGVQSGEDMLVRLASEGLKALDEEDLYRSEATRFGLPGGAAPSVMRQAPAALPAAPAAPANLLAGTPFDIGLPAPTNAMVAPTGFTREQVQNMLTSPSARVREQGKALVGTLPKEAEPTAGMREYQEAVRQGFKGTFMEYKQALQPKPAQVNVKLPEQERAFEGELGKGQAKKLMEDKVAADDARSIISTIDEGRRLLKSGVITGFGADFLTGLGAALNQAGISFAEDSVANTQAFTANMAANVGRIIKQFGAGTGLSNADREYAEKMAGGKVTLDRKSIERILDINERMARNVISLHNRNAAKVKTNVPLTVEEPPRAGPQAGGASVTLPDGRVMNFPNAEAAAAFKKAAGL